MLAIGLLLGGVAEWLFTKSKVEYSRDQATHEAKSELAIADERSRGKEETISTLQTTLEDNLQVANACQAEITDLKEQKARLETTLQKERQHQEEKVTFVEHGKVELKNAFKALAADALKDNNKSFHDQYAKPVNESLDKIDNKIVSLTQVTSDLGSGTTKLVTALQKPHVRGQWGEMQLRRVVEVAGMLEHCDFTEQKTISDGDGQVRPDMVVHLPGEKNIVVDSKAPLEAFLAATDAEDEDVRLDNLKLFCRHARKHIRDISKKSYDDKVDNTPEIALLFLPNEALFSAALTHDLEIIEHAAGRRVVLASPTTLIVLLCVVAYGWQEESLAANAKEISELAKELCRRLSVFGGHMKSLGPGLSRAVEAYNSAVGSLESRVLVQGRKFD